MGHMQFSASSDRPGPLGMKELLERHANSLWIPAHLTTEQSLAFVLDHFRRQVAAELAMVRIDLRCRSGKAI